MKRLVSEDARRRYPPISSYAFLSDTHTAALVGPNIPVEWFCVPRFDGESVFARILDRERGGDAGELWQEFDASLSRYLGGLVVVTLIEGGLSGLAMWLIGVPHAVALAVVSTIPYIGPWIGSVPALVVSFFVSPTAFVLTALTFLAIQQLEGNVLTPRIQGQAVRIHPIVVLIVVAAVQLAGLLGAIPALAVLRVIVDFLRERLYIRR